MRRIIQSLLTCIGLFYLPAARAQDPQLSQFYASQVYTNPAFAGADRRLRVSSSVRNQYTALKNNFKTAVLSVDGYAPKFNGGLGMLVSYDQAGDGYLQTLSVSGVYSYSIRVNREWTVNSAIQASLVQRTYDINRLRFGDQLNEISGYTGLPSEDIRNLNIQGTVYTNVSTGVLAYSENFYGGVAIHNLLEPNQSFVNQEIGSRLPVVQPRRYTLHGGLNIYTDHSRYRANRTILSPNLLYMQQQGFYQLNMGMYLKKEVLTLGMWFRQTSRNSDAVIVLVGLRLPAFKMGYSYDMAVSRSRTAKGGSHELSLIFSIKSLSNPRYKSKLLRCPDL